jgi:TRAP-type C4-dicarboxylate transport system permease small subunit
VKPILDFIFDRLATFVTAVTLTLALVVMGAQVIFRYALNDSLYWAEEVARYALIWSSMIGAAVAYRHGSHVAVTDVVKRLPLSLQRQVVRLVHALVFAFGAFLLWQGWALTLRNFARHQLSTSLEMEIAWIYLSMPIGGALLILAAGEAFARVAPVSAGDTVA